MSRRFKRADYEATLNQTISIGEALPAEHLARFVVDVVGQLDLQGIYVRYRRQGGEAYAPEVLVALLFYGYATGVFSSRKIEQATYEVVPFRYVAGDLHPDHDTLANFRKTFQSEIKALFVQVLMLAQTAGYLKLGNISLDGSKLHANASKSHAVSYGRLLELEAHLRQEVEQLFLLAEQVDRGLLASMPPGLNVEDEVTIRQQRLARLAEAKAVLEARAAERYAAEQAEYEAKQREREAKARRDKPQKPPGGGGGGGVGRLPEPPTQGPRDSDQYNFTDPDSRIMKCSNNGGFEQAYNAQIVVDQESLLIVAHALSNHPNDKAEVAPTLAALPSALGTPAAVAMDAGYFSAGNIAACEALGIEAYIATGGGTHRQSWQEYFAQAPEPPPADAAPKVRMAYKLQTTIGKAIYRQRKATVEPVIGIIKAVLGFRQFSLRGLAAVNDEWALVCLAFNLKRWHALSLG
jgi:transposase